MYEKSLQTEVVRVRMNKSTIFALIILPFLVFLFYLMLFTECASLLFKHNGVSPKFDLYKHEDTNNSRDDYVEVNINKELGLTGDGMGQKFADKVLQKNDFEDGNSFKISEEIDNTLENSSKEAQNKFESSLFFSFMHIIIYSDNPESSSESKEENNELSGQQDDNIDHNEEEYIAEEENSDLIPEKSVDENDETSIGEEENEINDSQTNNENDPTESENTHNFFSFISKLFGSILSTYKSVSDKRNTSESDLSEGNKGDNVDDNKNEEILTPENDTGEKFEIPDVNEELLMNVPSLPPDNTETIADNDSDISIESKSQGNLSICEQELTNGVEGEESNSNYSSIDFKIPNAFTCENNGNDLNLMIIIISDAENSEQRNAIRETWATVAKIGELKTKYAFMVGLSSSDEVGNKFKEESEKYQDLIQLNISDLFLLHFAYNVMFLKWINTYCPNVNHVIKINDNIFLNLPLILQFTHSDEINNSGMYGDLIIDDIPDRNSPGYKFISSQIFPDEILPNYLDEKGFLFPGKYAKDLFCEANSFPFFSNENVLVTGIIPQKLGIPRLDVSDNIANYSKIENQIEKCSFLKYSSVYSLNTEQMKTLWAEIKSTNFTCFNFLNNILEIVSLEKSMELTKNEEYDIIKILKGND